MTNIRYVLHWAHLRRKTSVCLTPASSTTAFCTSRLFSTFPASDFLVAVDWQGSWGINSRNASHHSISPPCSFILSEMNTSTIHQKLLCPKVWNICMYVFLVGLMIISDYSLFMDMIQVKGVKVCVCFFKSWSVYMNLWMPLHIPMSSLCKYVVDCEPSIYTKLEKLWRCHL